MLQTGEGEFGQASKPSGKIDALYLHVPFCFHKCHYCDFYSLVESREAGRDRQPPFVDALIRELRRGVAQYDLRPRTIFVGGGTPTLLRDELWARLLEAMDDLGLLDTVAEFTVEANPETVTPELMRILAAGGVNRLSIGAQSFQPRLLKTLERWHDPANVAKAVEAARAASIGNISLDLIFAIPGQTLALLDADLNAALSLAPTHLSCYNLMYEPNTALTTKLRLGRIRQVEEGLESRMYQWVMGRLNTAGFEHYEISNWAAGAGCPRTGGQGPGSGGATTHNGPWTSDNGPRTSDAELHRCQHNLAYWASRNWLGFGPAAASHVAGCRWKNMPHLGRYLAGSPTPPIVEEETLPPPQRLGEHLMLRLRLRAGVEQDWLQRHLPDDDPRWAAIDELIDQGLLERTPTHVRLTHRGVFVADPVIARLL